MTFQATGTSRHWLIKFISGQSFYIGKQGHWRLLSPNSNHFLIEGCCEKSSMERETTTLDSTSNIVILSKTGKDPTSFTSSTFLTSGREFLMNVILPILKS